MPTPVFLSPRGDDAASPRTHWLKLMDDGLLVDSRTGRAYLAADESGRLALQPLLGTAPARDRFTRAGTAIVHRDTGRAIAQTAEGLRLAESADASATDNTALISNALQQAQQNPTPYPTFAGGQAAAYTYACSLWKVADIRQQYPILTFNLQSHDSLLTPQFYPANQDGFTLTEWNDMCGQLLLELADVGNVRNLYDVWDDFNADVFSLKSTVLTDIQTALSIGASQTYTVSASTLIEGAFYAVFSAMGPASAFLANIMSAAYDAANQQGTWVPSFTVEYSQLLDAIITDYTNIIGAAVVQEQAILADYGATQTISSYCSNVLAATDEQLFDAVVAATNGFGAYALQTFLPSVAWIQRVLCVSGLPPESGPASTWYQAVNTNLYNQFNLVFQGANHYGGAPIPDLCMNFISNAGIPPEDVFLGLNGWNITPASNGTSIANWSGTFSTNYDAAMMVFLVNETPYALTVLSSAIGPYASYLNWLTPSGANLLPNGSTMLGVAYSYGSSINVGVYAGDTSASVVSFQATETVGFFSGDMVSVSAQNWIYPWGMTTPVAQQPFYGPGHGLPGVVVVTITNSSGS
ncbi:MAG TPA: hypothetical protein VM733_09020 [Thermoanaerobaculia bacterium]|nr:hypothetical protein [Thermoanaerobaculia bacterium]